MKYYIYPDGTISDELLDFMSDDFYVLQADSYEDAYEMALMMKLIWLERNKEWLHKPKRLRIMELLYVGKA